MLLFRLINRLTQNKLFSIGCFYFRFISGGSGQKSISSKRFLARGGQVNEGVTVVEIPSTYYWLPVEGTNFTVGIVVAVDDKDETLGIQDIPSGKYD